MGKVCKFSVDASDLKYPKVERVLEIDGQTIAKPEPDGDPEVKARLLASTLGLTQGDLENVLRWATGDWHDALNRLQGDGSWEGCRGGDNMNPEEINAFDSGFDAGVRCALEVLDNYSDVEDGARGHVRTMPCSTCRR